MADYKNGWYEGFMNEEYPVISNVFKKMKITIPSDVCVDVGCDIGSTALFLKKFGCKQVIGYDTDQSVKDHLLPNSIDSLHLNELSINELKEYIDKGYFLKFDCEGCEEKYLPYLKTYNNAMICIHNNVKDYTNESYSFMLNGYIPIFHSKDWKEICYINLPNF